MKAPSSSEEWKIRYEQKFARVHNEIEAIRLQVSEMTGWPFKWHTHSERKLLQLPHFDKIHSICEKIADDTANWYREGELPEKGLKAYKRGRQEVSQAMKDLRAEIKARKPTFLDKVLESLDGFVETLWRVLPSVKKLARFAARAAVPLSLGE